MKDREINIKVRNITPKQWTNLVIELNLMADAWKPYGPKMKLKTRNLERIIKWGRSIGDYNRRNRSSRKKVGQDEEFEV
jgi:predicted ATPase with chaperone activity|tara:strand:- start:510 stop:746 length:237 start_codon:yes stop_codon:yes gene_type:complete